MLLKPKTFNSQLTPSVGFNLVNMTQPCSLTQLLLVIVTVESFLQTKRRKEFAGLPVNNQNYPAFYLIAGVSLVVVFFFLDSFHFSLWLAIFRSCKK